MEDHKWTLSGRKIGLEFKAETENTEEITGSANTTRLWMSNIINLSTEVSKKEESAQVIVLHREKEQSEILGDLKKWMEDYAKKKTAG